MTEVKCPSCDATKSSIWGTREGHEILKCKSCELLYFRRPIEKQYDYEDYYPYLVYFGHFHNEEAAFAYVEAHLWPEGPGCPHCGNCDDKQIGRLTGKSSRPGLRKCYACRKTFTVRIGSIFEDSHFPLHLWLQAIQLITASKKGISTRQIQRAFKCSMKTAWFLMHRIREIMAPVSAASPMGGSGKTLSEAHLHRYLREFDFRYSHREKLGVNDTARASLALKGAKGRRLTYETTH